MEGAEFDGIALPVGEVGSGKEMARWASLRLARTSVRCMSREVVHF